MEKINNSCCGENTKICCTDLNRQCNCACKTDNCCKPETNECCTDTLEGCKCVDCKCCKSHVTCCHGVNVKSSCLDPNSGYQCASKTDNCCKSDTKECCTGTQEGCKCTNCQCYKQAQQGCCCGDKAKACCTDPNSGCCCSNKANKCCDATSKKECQVCQCCK
nr:cadmium-inducible metallothionein 3 [Tetrahymena thermophila]ABN42647.1 putative Cd-metallothionein [Tetrahymena thermophila]